MRIFDLSQPVTDGGPNSPVHPPVQLPRVADHPADGWRMEVFQFASHTGTHLDAPLHKLAGGASIDQFPLEAFVGPAHVVDLVGVGADHPIGPDDLAPALPGDLSGSIVLLNTGWGHRRAKSDEWHYHSSAVSLARGRGMARRAQREGHRHRPLTRSAQPRSR